MKKSNDRRIRYTRYALQNALIVCMQQKPFNRITVREICETADINRSTFYMHYKDIYELLDEIEEQVYQEIDAIFSKESPSIHNMEQLLDYVQTHKTLLECLLQQGSGLAISRFSTILHAHYGKYLRRYAGNGFSAENEYLYEFLYTGILGVLQKWLQNECKDDRNQVADVMWRMIVQSLPHTKNPHSFSSLTNHLKFLHFLCKSNKNHGTLKKFQNTIAFLHRMRYNKNRYRQKWNGLHCNHVSV